jgi:hypothetical protein
MTDAIPAPGVTDVWNLVLAVLARQPLPLGVLIVLGAIVVLLMAIDGIRANLKRRQPQTLHIVREDYGPPRTGQVFAATDKTKALPMRAFQPKRPVKRLSPHKAPRPVINRIPRDTALYQPSEAEAPHA